MFGQNEQMLALQQRWLALVPRERLLIKWMVGFLILFGLYQFVWSPLQHAKVHAQQRLMQAQTQWDWLNQQVPNILALQAQNRPSFATQSQLMAHLQQSLRAQGLINQMETIKPMPQGVQVVFARVEAARFFVWLSGLENQSLLAEKLQIEVLETGFIKVSVHYKVAA